MQFLSLGHGIRVANLPSGSFLLGSTSSHQLSIGPLSSPPLFTLLFPFHIQEPGIFLKEALLLWHLHESSGVSPSGLGRGSDPCSRGAWVRVLAASVETDSKFKY